LEAAPAVVQAAGSEAVQAVAGAADQGAGLAAG